MTKPYYSDDLVTLYHGDCREITEWLAADVLVTDPPYGMGYYLHSRAGTNAALEVSGDDSTAVRDEVLALWPRAKPSMTFGSWRNTKPACDQTIYWDKGEEAALGHPVFFSAVEEIYVRGSGWVGQRGPNVVRIKGLARGGATRKGTGHPTPKPVSLMERLISHAPHGAVIADPFAGSGPTLIAARNLRHRAVGVELDEKHCETIARRLSAGVLDFGESA